MTDPLTLPRYGRAYRVATVAVAVWVTVVLVRALTGDIANLPILEQTARNLYFHVPMWSRPSPAASRS